MLDDAANIPQDFDLPAYSGDAWAVYRGDQSYDVETWFTPDAARIVTETIWHHTQRSTSHKDGSITLKFHVDGLQEIANWLMSWAGGVKVIRPVELRDLVIQKLTTALKMHQE